MKTKITLILIALVFGFNLGYGQQDQECMNNLSIFSSYAKNKKYDEAYESWMKVRTDCAANFNRNVYVAGEKILEHKIKNSTGAEQLAFVKDLLTIYKGYNENFASKFPKGKMIGEVGNLSYKYRDALGLSDQQIYDIFEIGYTEDLENFTNPKGLYTYFKTMVNLFDAKKKTAQQLFDKYDDVNDKIETEVGKASEGLNKLIKKEEAGTALTKREGQFKRRYESLLKAFDQISDGVDGEIGKRANCEVLIPLYQEDFEKFKNDPKWLQRAMNKMYSKDCSSDPLFEKLVVQKNNIAPDAGTAFYLGTLNEEKGDRAEADKYFNQSMDLETDPLKKWKLVYRLAEKNRKKGSYGKARQYYNEALQLNPSNGAPYLKIANMYAASANNCGDSVFNKRAVYWLAAAEARKAGKVDGRLRSAAAKTAASYEAKAPTKTMIFQEGNSGQSIKIACWIGRSVRVP